MWSIVQIWYLHNTILNCQDWLDHLWSMKKMRLENDLTDCIDSLYVENEIKLSRPIEQGTVYDKDQIGQ